MYCTHCPASVSLPTPAPSSTVSFLEDILCLRPVLEGGRWAGAQGIMNLCCPSVSPCVGPKCFREICWWMHVRHTSRQCILGQRWTEKVFRARRSKVKVSDQARVIRWTHVELFVYLPVRRLSEYERWSFWTFKNYFNKKAFPDVKKIILSVHFVCFFPVVYSISRRKGHV